MHMLAGTRPVDERDPYPSVQLNYLSDMCSIKLHYDVTTMQETMQTARHGNTQLLPARHCLHGVTQLGFPVEQWLKQYPDSIYNVSSETFRTLVEGFPTVSPGESRGARSSTIASHAWAEEGHQIPQALVIVAQGCRQTLS
eukprot:3795616-Amphidinium_carterae.1